MFLSKRPNARKMMPRNWLLQRIVGLLLFLWQRDFFNKVGDAHGGYLGVDQETTGGKNLQWARILIKINGRKVSGRLQVVVRQLCFTVQ